MELNKPHICEVVEKKIELIQKSSTLNDKLLDVLEVKLNYKN